MCSAHHGIATNTLRNTFYVYLLFYLSFSGACHFATQQISTCGLWVTDRLLSSLLYNSVIIVISNNDRHCCVVVWVIYSFKKSSEICVLPTRRTSSTFLQSFPVTGTDAIIYVVGASSIILSLITYIDTSFVMKYLWKTRFKH